MHAVSFCIFGKGNETHSAPSANKHNKNYFKKSTLFCMFGESTQIYPAYLTKTRIFFPRIQQIRTNPLQVYGKGIQINPVI